MKVKNWERFQHYHTGKCAARPRWIKLYCDLLDNIDWAELPDSLARRLVEVWILASEKNGEIPDIRTLSFRLRISQDEAARVVEELYRRGWIEGEESPAQTAQSRNGLESSYNDSRTGLDAVYTESRAEKNRKEKKRKEEKRGTPPLDEWIREKDIQKLPECILDLYPSSAGWEAAAMETHRQIRGAAEIVGEARAWQAAADAWKAFVLKSTERGYERPASTWLSFLSRALSDCMPSEEERRHIEAANAAKRKNAIEAEIVRAQREAARTGDARPLAETIARLTRRFGAEAEEVARAHGVSREITRSAAG